LFFTEIKKVMSTYEMILEEGREEGRQQGRKEALWEITLQMLRNGFDEATIQSALKVDQDFINLVKQQLIQE
jgi:predicted transposase/invertase (TIGR01784 family)